MPVKAGEIGTKELILPHRNAQMEKARTWLESRSTGGKQVLPDQITYDVKLSSPHYLAPKQVTVNLSQKVPEKDRAGGRGTNISTSSNHNINTVERLSSKLSIEFRPKEPGLYPCTVMLTSDVDTRVYQVEGIGTAPNTHCALRFTTQARKHIIQEIPLVNPTERDWPVKATLTQSGHEFDGPREFIARKRQPNGQPMTSLYALTFRPEWVCDVKGQLVLYNTGTNETYEYELLGISEDPLAEEHVVLRCEAREKIAHNFLVRNYSNTTATFEVESDLLHISGPSSITVEARGSAEYELIFQPLQAGQVTGCILFRDNQSGHFTWYTVELVTLPPKPQQTLALTCVVRQAVAVDIQLVNPMDDVVVFGVALNGDGLIGETEFVLAPNETATYELVFSPLTPFRRKGTAVFFNEMVGEFWYDLELLAEAAPPEELSLMECELGRVAQTTVKIENPTGHDLVLKHRSTNKVNFRVLQQRVVLPPLETATFTIEYSPSNFEVEEDAQIIFEHATMGQWIYKLKGIGLAPAEANNVTVVAQVNRPASATITFKNPFLETIHAHIILESENERGVFTLLNKRAKVQLGPLASTQIPFLFSPQSMTQHLAELAVRVTKPRLTWTYVIQGVAEAPTDPTLHTFTVQAREALSTYYTLNLIGLGLHSDDKYGGALTCSLELPEQHEALVNRCFKLTLKESPDSAERPKKDHQLSLHVQFTPLKPFVAHCGLAITRNTGGRWRFDLKIEATEPDPDDTISIQSPLNKPASVAFRLCNHTTAYAEFNAFFDAESAYEFTVQPTSGVLEPSGTNGTTFIVTYKPTEYGMPDVGKLIIETQDVYWSYVVRGTHPKYSAPVADKPKVATRLSKDVQLQLAQNTANRRKKNFIRENIQGSVQLASPDRGGY